MTQFVEIFDTPLPAGAAEDALYDLARSLGWRVLLPGTQPDLPERRSSVFVGAVAWSRPDLEILDQIAAKGNKWNKTIWFFNPALWTPPILPGLPIMTATPMLAEYVGSRPVGFVQSRPRVLALIDAIF